MATQIDHVLHHLRQKIITGELPSGSRMVELDLAALLSVSRTPIRIALGELEKEGLLERLATRGFRVRRFTASEVADAIDVRGALEGMAARQIAEQGLSAEVRDQLQSCVADGQRLLLQARSDSHVVDAVGWVAMNAAFHRVLVQAAGNSTLASALAHVGRTPMASAGALSLNGTLPLLEYEFIRRAQSDHEDVLAALMAGEGTRAEALMREHARRSRNNKRALMAHWPMRSPP
ncbi:MAG: transcriptional regulator, GntR family [Polaromonas sp.]|nr:transcriptional regulator, GntR family [Polaromonas sp.]MDB5842990.1 transcriptional regulator, GntR family [Polaromonas sp.]